MEVFFFFKKTMIDLLHTLSFLMFILFLDVPKNRTRNDDLPFDTTPS